MGIFNPREKSKEISKGKEFPRNLDKNNKVIQEAEKYADSIQKILKGWERNLPQIEKLIKNIAKNDTYDYDSKVYQAKRILRKWGGDTRLAKGIVDKYT